MSEERKISRIVKMIDLACAIESGENVLPPPVSASSKPAKKTTDDDDVDDDDANDDNDNDNKKSEGETIAAAATTTEPAQKKRKPTLTIEEEEAIFAEGDSDNDDGDDDDDDDDFKAPSKAKSDVKNNKNIDDDDDDDDDDEKGRKMKRGRKQRKNKKDAPVIGKRIMMNIFEKEFPEYVFSREEVESLTPEQQAYLSCLKVNELKTKLAKNGVSTAGGKRSLVNKVAHCVSVGVPPKCPKCKTGTLRMVGESKFACTGFYKPDDGSEEVKCDFVSDKVDLIPWVAEDGCFL